MQVIHAKALFDCVGDEDSELTFREGDLLTHVRETSEEGWLHGRLERTGEEGLFPDNYVEIIQVKAEVSPSKATAPPQLPVRSLIGSKSASPATTSLRPEAGPESRTLQQTAATFTTAAAGKPSLPIRKDPVSQAASPIPKSLQALRSVAGSDAPSKVALPGLGSRSMYGSTTNTSGTSLTGPNGGSEAGRAMSGPPALPRRSNTAHEKTNGNSDNGVEQGGPPLSVRERMANLSMTNQQRQINSSASSSPLPSPSFPPSNSLTASGSQQPAPLPPRPNATSAVRSPLSSAARPALPPRTSPSPPPPSSAGPGTAGEKYVYQVPESTVPVPKLTTFARPRSARTAKSPTSPTQAKAIPTASPAQSTSTTLSTPPKLPSRTPSTTTVPASTSATTSSVKPANTPSTSSGPVRFSPTAARQVPTVEMSALPTITRNLQPLPLPSRTHLNNSAIPSPLSSPAAKTSFQGLSRAATTAGFEAGASAIERNGNRATTSDDSDAPAGSAFGVKLNSIGSRTPQSTDSRTIPTISAPGTSTPLTDPAKDMAPPLPIRSNTIPSTSSNSSQSGSSAGVERPTTPLMNKLHQKQHYQRPSTKPTSNSTAQMARDHQIAKALSQHEQAQEKNSVLPGNYESNAIGTLQNLMSGKSPYIGKSGSTTGTAIPPPPDVAIPGNVGVRKEVRRRYEALFRTVCKGDYIEGAQVYAIYVRSRLDSKTLAQIWDLVDVDNAGRLSRAQFCMGLYLIDERLASGLIPLEVSDELWVSVMQ